MIDTVNSVLVAGGGTAGWMTAAALRKALPKHVEIVLVESDQISTVGVGEATIPPIQDFNRFLGVDEAEFLRKTKGTIKLGIDFEGWGGSNKPYFHPFGSYLPDKTGVQFSDYWNALKLGGTHPAIEECSITTMAARELKFSDCSRASSFPLNSLGYAYHFDATLYAALLRSYAEEGGVRRIAATIDRVELDKKGSISKLYTKESGCLTADFFIDCTGFRSLLLGKALGVPFTSWKEYLPCDRAVVVQSERLQYMPPYTSSRTLESGWKWTIPLQHKTGNGYVYCSKFSSEEEAVARLKEYTEGRILGEPRLIDFEAGYRSECWKSNCVAIGLSSGFIEPLESTSIHLIQSAIYRLIRFFPKVNGFESPSWHFNNEFNREISNLRDFITLHYVTSKASGEFWDFCRNDLKVSERYKHRIDLYQNLGINNHDWLDIFGQESWLSVMEGQGVTAGEFSLRCDAIESQNLLGCIDKDVSKIKLACSVLSSHQEYISKLMDK